MKIRIKGRPVKLQIPNVLELVAMGPAIDRVIKAGAALFRDDDGDGKSFEFEEGELEELIDSVRALYFAARALNPVQYL